jgi:DNA replication protein DnaC
MMKELREKARKLGFKAIVGNWEHYANQPWLEDLLLAEEQEKDRKSLERRIREAQIGQFKPMSEMDWDWPDRIDRVQIEDLFSLSFLLEKVNVALVGTNGLAKTMIAQNLAHLALTEGHTTRFVQASQMLNQLAQCDGAGARARCIRKYCSADLLVIDEVGYLGYDNKYADLLFEVISGRYRKKSTILTTNKSFKQWGEIFPNAACVVTLVDRLLHKAEVILIEGESYRHKEAEERAVAKENERKSRQTKKKGAPAKC